MTERLFSVCGAYRIEDMEDVEDIDRVCGGMENALFGTEVMVENDWDEALFMGESGGVNGRTFVGCESKAEWRNDTGITGVIGLPGMLVIEGAL